MCGLAGFLCTGVTNKESNEMLLHAMANTLTHRGPNDSGIWHDEAGIGLAHRRLSIVDLP